jgi:hypothetical protein
MNKINYILFIATILLSYSCIAILFTDTTVLSSRQGGSQVACEGMNFNVSGNVTLKTAIKLSGATGQNIKLYNGSCGQPFGAPVLDYDTTVTGDNSTFPDYPLFVGNIYYICVDYNTNPYTQGFDDFVTPSIGNKVTWISSCTAIGGHTDNSYTRDIYGLVTELSCVANWTQSNTSCILNQQQILYTDSHNCNDNSSLPSNNGTFISCGCFENWVNNATLCDGINKTIKYYDANECHTYNSLPSDNGTSQHCAICNRQCKDKETPYTNCCILFPIGNFSNYEILDNKLNIITAGTTYPTSLLNQNYLIFNEPVGIYHIIINDGVNYFTTDIEVTESNIYDSVTNIFAVAIIILSLIAILYFVNKKKSQS